MDKKKKRFLIISTIITLLPIVVGIVLWDQLPDVMATHFDSDWEPNGWSSKTFTVFGLPAIIAALHLLCCTVTERDPRRAGYPKIMMKLMYGICPVVSWFAMLTTYGYALGIEFKNMNSLLSIILGALFVFLGNYLPKVKQNRYLGIKLPWTYASEDNWNKTHRMAGKLWVIGGLLMLLNVLLRIKGLELPVMLVMIFVPCVYSYAYSRKETKRD